MRKTLNLALVVLVVIVALALTRLFLIVTGWLYSVIFSIVMMVLLVAAATLLIQGARKRPKPK